MNLLLVDTGPLVALADKRDKAHASFIDFLKAYRGRLLSTWAVLTVFSPPRPRGRGHLAALSMGGARRAGIAAAGAG